METYSYSASINNHWIFGMKCEIHKILPTIPSDQENRKPIICQIEYEPVQTHHTSNMKDNVKLEKYQDLARERRKIWNMMVIVGILGTVPKTIA